MKRTLNLALLGLASAVSTSAFAQTISVAGPFDFYDTLTGTEAAFNTVVPNAATVGTAYQFGTNATVDSITVNSLLAGTWESEAAVRLVNSAFPTLGATVNFSSTGAAFTSFSIAAPTVRALTANTLVASNLPSGSTWTLTFHETFNDGPGADANGTNLVMTPGVYVPPPPPPPKTPWPSYVGNTRPVIYDNGTIISTAGLGAGSGGLNASIIGTGGTTFGYTSLAPTFKLADDFVVNSTWTVTAVSAFAYQTNSSPTAPPFASALVEIWNGNPSLPTSSVIASSTALGDLVFSEAYRVTATTLTNTQRPVIRVQSTFSGLTLAPGTYWVTYQMNTLAGGSFTPYVLLLDGGVYPGNALQRTAVGAPDTWVPILDNSINVDVPFLVHGTAAPANQTISGTLNLNDTVFGGSYTRAITGTVKQGTTTVGSISVTGISASSTAFAGSISAGATGAATIEWDGSSFLLRKTNITLTGSNQSIGTVSMQNGDVDGSGEVDAADIDEVIANFGSSSDIASDVDVSGEVDAADIDVVIANFGGTDD